MHLLLVLLLGLKHLREVKRQEDGPFGAVVWPEDLDFLHQDACAMMLACPVKNTRSWFIHTVVARYKRIILPSLPFVHIVARCGTEHLTLTTLKLS